MPDTPIINASMRSFPRLACEASSSPGWYYFERMNSEQLQASIGLAVDGLIQSVSQHPHLAHLDRVYLPRRDTIVHITRQLRQLMFPGYFEEQGLTSQQMRERTEALVKDVAMRLYDQVRDCVRYQQHIPRESRMGNECIECDERAREVVAAFLERLPAVRELLASDVRASFEGDPAAQSADETIFSYPGLFAITVQRLAHEFCKLEVPLLPRIMTEFAHSQTGIDIHPGAKLGRSFFIDHGTGVVIGETSEIGSNVKIYQGVTLGALAPAYGQMLRGTKRHPTIEDDVTIYAGSTILGGDTVIGKGTTIGGNVFITSSVPPHHIVSADPPHLKYRNRAPRAGRRGHTALDFQI
jgi:serine O-acetyltransferase